MKHTLLALTTLALLSHSAFASTGKCEESNGYKSLIASEVAFNQDTGAIADPQSITITYKNGTMNGIEDYSIVVTKNNNLLVTLIGPDQRPMMRTSHLLLCSKK